MAGRSFYITTAIPYVNADPHVGFALEAVQADIVARHRRLHGDRVRFLSGTDDHSLKNVIAARAAGVPISEFVNERAQRFADLSGELALSYDDFVRTSVDPRHRLGVERLWRTCVARGDLYERDYEGLYCVGCEAFLSSDDLDRHGLCLEHRNPPEPVAERNWFFRLSRFENLLLDSIESGSLRIEPEQRRDEALQFVRAGLADFSVSRSSERAGGWGISVPNDPAQVISVWFDALANYISALDYGTSGDIYHAWWEEADERVHIIGKGILRFPPCTGRRSSIPPVARSRPRSSSTTTSPWTATSCRSRAPLRRSIRVPSHRDTAATAYVGGSRVTCGRLPTPIL